LRITEINDVDRFFDLEDKWDKILDQCRDGHILLTWEFLSTYVKHFGRAKDLIILCVEDKKRLIAIAPLRRSRYSLFSLGYNVIEPLAYRYADYTGLIMTEKERECFILFLSYLMQNDDWDFLHLFDVPGTSVLLGLLPKVHESIPIALEPKEGRICPYMSLPKSVDQFKERLRRSFRRDLERCMRKLEKDYGKTELKRNEEMGPFEEAMNVFIGLHQKRWKSKGMPGVFSTQESRSFDVDVAKCFANKGWVAFYFLTVKDEPIAAQYCLEYKQKMLYGLGGFDPDYSQYSVGNLLLAKVIEDCIKRRIEEYDFMKGDEPYKFQWSAAYRRNFGVRIVNRKMTSTLFDIGIKATKHLKIEKLLGKNLTSRTAHR
jgi:hypothetical protein